MNYQKTEVMVIDHIGITVSDIDDAPHFLENTFGAIALYDKTKWKAG